MDRNKAEKYETGNVDLHDNYTILYYTILYYTILYYTILYYTLFKLQKYIHVNVKDNKTTQNKYI